MHPHGLEDLIEETYAAIDAQGAAYTRTLDEYLRALWGLLLLARTAPPQSDDDSLPPFRYLEEVILFQIADLWRIEASDRKMGPWDNIAPTGHTWNNLCTLQYLECAISGVVDHHRAVTETFIRHFPEPPTWRTLAAILELGRLYE